VAKKCLETVNMPGRTTCVIQKKAGHGSVRWDSYTPVPAYRGLGKIDKQDGDIQRDGNLGTVPPPPTRGGCKCRQVEMMNSREGQPARDKSGSAGEGQVSTCQKDTPESLTCERWRSIPMINAIYNRKF